MPLKQRSRRKPERPPETGTVSPRPFPGRFSFCPAGPRRLKGRAEYAIMGADRFPGHKKTEVLPIIKKRLFSLILLLVFTLSALPLRAGAEAADSAGAVEGAVSLSVLTNMDYGTSNVVFRNEVVTVYLREVGFWETGNMYGDNVMSFSFRLEMDPEYFPPIPGYSATGELASVKAGGQPAKLLSQPSEGLMSYSLQEKSMVYVIENPGKLPVDLEIELKSSRNNPKKFSYPIGPVHVEIAGDIYDSADSRTAEAVSGSVSLGGLLRREPVPVLDQGGVTMTATGFMVNDLSEYYGGDHRELNLILSVSNANQWDVMLYLPDFDEAVLNGKKYRVMLQNMTSRSMPDMMASVPANSENTVFYLSFQPQDSTAPLPQELESGEFALQALMPTSDELAGQSVWRWPELFNLAPLSFDMAYDGDPEPEAVTLPLPPLTDMGGQEIFSFGGVTLSCEYADFIPYGGKAALSGFGTLRNETGSALGVTLEFPSVNGQSAPGFSLALSDGADRVAACPAGGECGAQITFLLPEGVMPDDVREITCVLRYFDPETRKNIVWQPVILVPAAE